MYIISHITSGVQPVINFAGGLRGRCKKKVKKKLTSVSFAFTHTYTLEKLALLFFPPSVHGQFSAGISPKNW